jgi:hypothetical protein
MQLPCGGHGSTGVASMKSLVLAGLVALAFLSVVADGYAQRIRVQPRPRPVHTVVIVHR